ncbi:MAG: hypothetical protein FWD63_02270 [Propionibacteriaceae bacterium]|nr:hypothetical protein [Propionibacteriaceae bacterium]
MNDDKPDVTDLGEIDGPSPVDDNALPSPASGDQRQLEDEETSAVEAWLIRVGALGRRYILNPVEAPFKTVWRRHRNWIWVTLLVLVVALVAMLTVGPWGPRARHQRLQTQSVAVFSAFMTDWVAAEAASWEIGYGPTFFDQYLAEPAGHAADEMFTILRIGNNISAVGVPYFAITRWAPLQDSVGHADAATGMTVCWVQGNLVTSTRLKSREPVTTGPSPTAHVWDVFFKVTQGDRPDQDRGDIRVHAPVCSHESTILGLYGPDGRRQVVCADDWVGTK